MSFVFDIYLNTQYCMVILSIKVIGQIVGFRSDRPSLPTHPVLIPIYMII